VFIDGKFLGKGRVADQSAGYFDWSAIFKHFPEIRQGQCVFTATTSAAHLQPTDGSGPDSKPAQCPGQSCDHPGCPRANNGEFDHSGYYRYIPQQPGTDRTDDEGDSDVQLEEVVGDLSDWVDLIDSDTNSRIDFYRNRTYKLEDRVDAIHEAVVWMLPAVGLGAVLIAVGVYMQWFVAFLIGAAIIALYAVGIACILGDAKDK
jgi:hypothetical protein